MTGPEAVGVGLGFLAIVAPEFWPKMPRSLSYSLAGIGLSWLTFSLILGIEELSHTRLQYGPIGAIIVGAILIAGGLFWHISRLGNETNLSEDASKIVTTRTAFAQRESIKVMPNFLGGNDTLHLDTVGTLRLTAPYSNTFVTLMLDATPLRFPDQKTPSGEVADMHVTFGKVQQFVFDTAQNRRQELTISGRTFIVTLEEIKVLNVPNVAKPLEYDFAISEK